MNARSEITTSKLELGIGASSTGDGYLERGSPTKILRNVRGPSNGPRRGHTVKPEKSTKYDNKIYVVFLFPPGVPLLVPDSNSREPPGEKLTRQSASAPSATVKYLLSFSTNAEEKLLLGWNICRHSTVDASINVFDDRPTPFFKIPTSRRVSFARAYKSSNFSIDRALRGRESNDLSLERTRRNFAKNRNERDGRPSSNVRRKSSFPRAMFLGKRKGFFGI